MALPTTVWRDFRNKDVSASGSFSEDDSADVEKFLQNRTTYQSTTKSGGKTLINNWYIGGVMYAKRNMKKTKKVYHPFTGQVLLENDDAMFRIGLYKKDNYNTFIDLHDIGKNSRYLLSTAEFDAMDFKEKVQ